MAFTDAPQMHAPQSRPLAAMPDVARAEPDGRTSSEAVYRGILALIMDGAVRPGDVLSETVLAERFAVSRTPVREALQHLAHFGLAERGPRRAFVLRRLDPPALDDAFEALAEIEALTAQMAARRMTQVEQRELEGLIAEGRACVAADDGRAYARINVAFHDCLVRAARNVTLSEMADLVRIRLSPYRDEQFVRSDRLSSSQAEHEAIGAAILEGDGEAAAAVMRRHIATTALNVRRMVEAGEPAR